jgi:hypothetical protein
MGAPHGHISPWPASAVASAIPSNRDYSDPALQLPGRARNWFFPWYQLVYPGCNAGFLSLLPRPYAWQAVQHWMKGRRAMPADVARSLAEAVRTRVEIGLTLAADLEAYADRQASEQRPTGFCSVGADGKDKRGHWRR